MRGLGLDLRYAFRGLGRQRGFAAIAVLTLALGIGAATAMFSVVNAALLRPLPYPEPDGVAWVAISFPSVRGELMPGPDYVEWREQNQVFEDMAAFGWRSFDLSGRGEPMRLICGRVTENFLPLLRIQPTLGRGFLIEEDTPGGPKALILSHGLWQSRFGGDQTIVGSPLTLNGEPYTVVGVLPAHFRFPGRRKVDALVPQQLDYAAQRDRRQMRIVHTVARLRGGVTVEDARADLTRLLDNSRQRFPKMYREDNAAQVKPLHEYETRDSRTAVLVLFFAVALVLLIACANVANLLLVRAAGRKREIAVRSALGAGRARLARLLLAESGLLGVMGGSLGLVFAVASVRGLVRLAPDGVPGLAEASIDETVFGFTVAATLVTSLLFGLAPVFGTGKPRLRERLQEGGGQPGVASAGRLRGALVVGELALSFVLLASAALLLESLWRMANVQLGFQPESIVTTWIQLNPSQYAGKARQIAFWEEVLERSARIPATDAVAGWEAACAVAVGAPELALAGFEAPPPSSPRP